MNNLDDQAWRRSGNLKRKLRAPRRRSDIISPSATTSIVATPTAETSTTATATTGIATESTATAASATGQAALFSIAVSQDTTTIDVIEVTITKTHYHTLSTETSGLSSTSSNASSAGDAEATTSASPETSSSTSVGLISQSSKKVPTALIAVLCSLVSLAILTALILWLLRRYKERRRDATLSAVAAAAAAVEKDIAGAGDFGRPDSPSAAKEATSKTSRAKYLWGPRGLIRQSDQDHQARKLSTDGSSIHSAKKSCFSNARPLISRPQPQPHPQPQLHPRPLRPRPPPPQMRQVNPSGPHPTYLPPPPFTPQVRSSNIGVTSNVPSPLGRSSEISDNTTTTPKTSPGSHESRFYSPEVRHLIQQVGNKETLSVSIDRAREAARGTGRMRQYRSNSSFVL